MNGDGKVDLVTANDGDTTVTLLIGVGNGTFQPMSNLPAGNNPKGVTLADINGDGDLDILAVDAAEQLRDVRPQPRW